jgi:ribosomal protein S18 acetylase RimI-like enzyme
MQPGCQVSKSLTFTWHGSNVGLRTMVVLVADTQGIFAGFAAGWVEQDDNIAETADSNRFGYISDICVMPAYRGQRIALQLLFNLERHLLRAGVTRVRIASLATNAAARGTYERGGFVPYEIIYEKSMGGAA